jgi:CheY-like chemotaxis protein
VPRLDVKRNIPDLIVCDIYMPQLDGIAPPKAIRDSRSWSIYPSVHGAADHVNDAGSELGWRFFDA